MVFRSGRKTSGCTNTIKITAGLGSIDEYISYVEAGADELFIGYVSEKWMKHFGMKAPLNRREVRYYNVQIGSESELHILHDMIEEYGVPVAITLNALSFLPAQYPYVLSYMEECLQAGFDTFIVADPGLLVSISMSPLADKVKLHISGEIGEMNEEMVALCKKWMANRIIFHRKVTLDDMEGMIKVHKDMEYEAFILNEMCHFHGGFCNSLHCDELCHMCLVPYQLSEADKTWKLQEQMDISDIPGASGCGLCALWRMRKMGIHYVKLVSRGNYVNDTIRDIKALKMAIEEADHAPDEETFIKNMKNKIFPAGCSKNCYYRESFIIN